MMDESPNLTAALIGQGRINSNTLTVDKSTVSMSE